MNMQHETDNATGAVTTPEEGMTEEQFLKEYKKKEYPNPLSPLILQCFAVFEMALSCSSSDAQGIRLEAAGLCREDLSTRTRT